MLWPVLLPRVPRPAFRRALTASVDSCAEDGKECHFSGVTRSGRVWSKVPESDAGSVRYGNGWRKAVAVDQSVLGRSLWHSVQAVTDRPLPVKSDVNSLEDYNNNVTE